MNNHLSHFRVTTAEPRLLSQFETFRGINEAVGASDNFEYEVVAKLDCKVRAKLEGMSDEDFEAALEAAKLAVLADKDKELQTLQRRLDAADGALDTAASNARAAAVDINHRGHGVYQAQDFVKKRRRTYIPTQELATSQSIHQMHIQNESKGRLQIENMTSELGIRKSIRTHLASQPPPSRERVKEILGKLKLDAEKLEAEKSKEVSQKLNKLEMKDDVRRMVNVLPVNIRAAIADSFTSEFPILMEKGLSNIVENPVAFIALRKAIDQGEKAVTTGDAEIDKTVNAFLASLTDEEEDALKKFFVALDGQTAAALANPEAFGVTPENQEAFIADRIALIKDILKSFDGKASKLPSPSAEEGKFFIQKGLLMMSGVDVATLEKGNWDTNPVPMLKEDTPEAQMAKLAGLLLFCIGTAESMKQSLKNLTDSKEKKPESFTDLDNEQLEKKLKEAQEKRTKDKSIGDLNKDLGKMREELTKKEDAKRKEGEEEIKAQTEKIKGLEVLEKEIADLNAEKTKRTEAVTKAHSWITKKGGIKLEKTDLLAPCKLTFPEDSFAHPWGASGITKTFDSKLPVTFSESENVIQIGETTIRVAPAPVGEDIILTTGTKVETVYAISPTITDRTSYEKARETDNAAFMRSRLAVRDRADVYANEIGLDPSRLAYSPKASADPDTVIATLARSGGTDIPEYVQESVRTDPATKAGIEKTKAELTTYQATFAELTKLTGDKVEVRLMPSSMRTPTKLVELKARIDLLATHPNKNKLLEKDKYVTLTDSILGADPTKAYFRSDAIVRITDDAMIGKLIGAIDAIVGAPAPAPVVPGAVPVFLGRARAWLGI
jgi:hypothetical protein